MKDELERKAVSILEDCHDLALATLREDGFPQATTVSFTHDGLEVFFGVGAESQKATNMLRDPRVSITATAPYDTWNHIRGVSLAGRASELTTEEEISQSVERMMKRFPQVADMEPVMAEGVKFFRVTPFVVSVLDYSKGFGHTDMIHLDDRDIAESLESMKHRWVVAID